MLNKLIKVKNILSWDLSQARYLKQGVAAAFEHKEMLASLTIEVLVDVGANKGQFSLLAKTLHPQLIVHAFEPLEMPCNKYNSIFDGVSDVTLHGCAIGEIRGQQEIHVSKKQDSSSLLPIGTLQSQIFPGTEESHVEMIQVMRLDDVLSEEDLSRKGALLKIDVQGFELDVLRGSESLLFKFDNIYVECSFVELYEGQALASKVIEYLSNQGFVLKGVYNVSYDEFGVAVQADILFDRDDL